MDRYEYKLKTEQIQKLVVRKEYKAALQIVDTIDWRKVRDVKTLSSAAEVYVAAHRYEEALDMLEQAYENAPIGRRVLYRLTEVAVLAKNAEAARAYLTEFKNVAPNDSGQYILEYRLAKLQKDSLGERIAILEKYQQSEFDERWSYELARLYADAGRTEECVKLCDDIILWFNLGKYVDKALELKAKYAPLTESQQARMDHPAPEPLEDDSADAEESAAFVPDNGSEPEETVPEEVLADEDLSALEESREAGESPELTAEPELPGEPAEEAAAEQGQSSAGTHRFKIPGLSWLFGAREEAPEKPETEDDLSEEAQLGEPEEEPAAEELRTEDDTDWIAGAVDTILEEARQEAPGSEAAGEEALLAEQSEKVEEPAEEAEEPAANSAERVNAVSEARVAAAPEEDELEQLLRDPTVRSAAETGDVFSAAIRPAEEDGAEDGEEDEMLEGQLEFDFLRMDAVAMAKEEREKALGIWDDPFREPVMQEPEEEAQIRLIFSGTEQDLLRAGMPTGENAAEPAAVSEEPAGTAEPAEAADVTAVEAPAADEEPVESSSDEEPVEAEKMALAEPAEPEGMTVLEELEPMKAAEGSAESEPMKTAEEPAGSEPMKATEKPAESEGATYAEKAVADEPAEESAEVEETAAVEAEPAEPAAEVREPVEPEAFSAMAEEPAEELPLTGIVVEEEPGAESGKEKRQTSARPLLEEVPGPDAPVLFPAEEPAAEEPEEAPSRSEEAEVSSEPEEAEMSSESEAERAVNASARRTKAWSRHNMLVRSDDSKAGIELAMGFLTRIPAEERLPSVAKTYGDKLNRKRWSELEEKLKGRILLVGDANKMDDACLERLREYLTREGHMAVLIDTEENIAQIGLRNKALLDMFPTEYAYYEYSDEEIVHHGVEYAQSRGWTLDDMAMLAYSAAVESMPDQPKGRELIEAENIIDDAIETAEQRTMGRLVKRVLGGKKEKGNILREAHFRNS